MNGLFIYGSVKKMDIFFKKQKNIKKFSDRLIK